MMVKLEGTQAQRLRRFTYWRTAPDGQRQKMWRLGQAKSHEGFPSVTSFKYLGVMLSYGNFEKATLKHRLQEGNAKLQQVRRFVHNRRTAGPRLRLHIWHSTVWATGIIGASRRGAHGGDSNASPGLARQKDQSSPQLSSASHA